MAEERIDIKVTDSGADKAAKGLRDIAAEANKAEAAIRKLESAMSSSPVAKVQAMAGSMNNATNAAQRMASATSANATAANNAANAQTRVASAMSNVAAKTQAATAATNAHTAAVNKAGNATKLAGHHQANLIAQLNDIGVSLASGQNPFIVMIQQGSQLQDLSMRVDGGFKTLAATVGRMVAPFAAAAAIFGVMAGNFIIWKNELNDTAGLDKYVQTLGLTKKEIEELEDVHITMGDVASGVWATLNDAFNVEDKLDSVKGWIASAFKFAGNIVKNFGIYTIAAFEGLLKTVVTVWKQFPAALGDIFVQAVNGALGALETLANKTVGFLNSLGAGIGEVTIGRMANAWAGAANNLDAQVQRNFTESLEKTKSNVDTAIDYIGKKTKEAARARLGAQAAELIEDRGPGRKGPRQRVDRTEENRAHALEMVNKQLDGEISRLRMLKPEREIQQRFDQIEQSLAQKKIKLTDDEARAIRDKIVAIREETEVQAARDRIMESTNAPQRNYNATVKALNELLKDGQINMQRYFGELQNAERAMDEATDPLYKLNKELDDQYKAMGLMGDALADHIYLERIRQEFQAKGLALYDAETGKINAQAQALLNKNAAQRHEQYANDQLQGVLDPIQNQSKEIEAQDAVYAALEERRQANLIREDEYQRALAELYVKYNGYKLEAASGFFGALASVTKNGYGAVGAISKAAAVAEATIQGYLAVQKALASLPPPFSYVAAAAVAIKTGAQVAGIMSTNVGSFATGGQFMVGGRDGVDKNNINMNVTKGERVTIETPAQQRATDAALAGGGQAAAPTNITNVNVVDPRFVLDSMDTSEGGRVITNIITANKREINAILGNR